MAARPDPPTSIGAAARSGAIAGLIGGLAFGAAMIELGVLPSVASLVRTDSPLVGVVVHMTIAAIVGSGLGILLRGRWSAGDLVLWGVTYAAFFWFLGPLTLQPLILERLPAWDVAAAQAAFPSLLGHVTWGATAGFALAAIATLKAAPPGFAAAGTAGRPARSAGILVRGLLAGIVAYALVDWLSSGALSSSWSAFVGDGGDTGDITARIIAVVAAILYAVLHPRSTSTAGAAVARGAGVGFIVWVLGALTLIPVLRGAGLDWTLDDARAGFPVLLGGILVGGTTALVYHWLCRLAEVFLSDRTEGRSPDAGAWGPRAVLRGMVAGLVGGVLFTVVMVQGGFLMNVAGLVGSDSMVVALVVHFAIAEIVGISYALLFRRQAFDAASATGWGVSYGFVWWVLGPLTLAPVILGSTPAWTVNAAAAAFPSLIGHLAFGAGLGLSFHALEAHYSPWWITRTGAEAIRMERRRLEATTAGPALWALLVLVAMLLPMVLAP